ncbi:MAG: VWA domain-containing protein [Bacteriovorax sp.]|nr:VWA domain-containing protein [Bacteriovorax sp.]
MKYLVLIILLFTISCSKATKYAYYENIAPIEVDRRIYPLSLLESDKDIDVLFVIDNSASMQGIHQNIVRNSKIFLEQFAKQPYINWKIGVVSTDRHDDPYLGFATPFDYKLIDARDPTSFDRTVAQFQNAVSALGVDGDSSEYEFYNVKRVVDLYNGQNGKPSFLRANSHLVVIMITDAKEQSMLDFGAAYDVPTFVKTMGGYIPANKILRFYGALSRIDLKDCNNPEDYEPYVGSPFEAIINQTKGFNISACISDFGTDLAKIGKDIASIVGLPSLLLKQRPVASTLKVYYKNKLLSPGRKEDGGIWFYEESTNTINFYTMDFVEDARNDYFKIEFDIDDGNNRS